MADSKMDRVNQVAAKAKSSLADLDRTLGILENQAKFAGADSYSSKAGGWKRTIGQVYNEVESTKPEEGKSETVTLRKGTTVKNLSTGRTGTLKSDITVEDPEHFFGADGTEMAVAVTKIGGLPPDDARQVGQLVGQLNAVRRALAEIRPNASVIPARNLDRASNGLLNVIEILEDLR